MEFDSTHQQAYIINESEFLIQTVCINFKQLSITIEILGFNKDSSFTNSCHMTITISIRIEVLKEF